MNLALTRRGFLGALTVALAAATAPLALAAGRKPFVVEGEHVDSLVWHLWDRERAPIGPLAVHEVLPWDGIGYPIVLRQHGYRSSALFRGWYDFEWSNLRRDVPARFWARSDAARYPNIHSFVREQRFGESPEVMRLTMERNRLFGDRLHPVRRDRQPFAYCKWNGRTGSYDLLAA